MNRNLLAPCNYYCGNCILFKKNKCLACAKESRKDQAEGKVFCEIYLCAKDKKLVACSDCDQYPCEKYDKGIFASGFIQFIKDKLKEP